MADKTSTSPKRKPKSSATGSISRAPGEPIRVVSYSTIDAVKAGSVLRKWCFAQAKGSVPVPETLSGALVIADKVAKGLPTKAVDEVIEVGLVEPEVVYELVVPRRTLADRKQKGKPLTPEQSDRLARILRILTRAEEAIGDITRAARWMRKENRALAGKRPIDLLGSDAGARAVEKVLGRLEHGVIS